VLDGVVDIFSIEMFFFGFHRLLGQVNSLPFFGLQFSFQKKNFFFTEGMPAAATDYAS
jgi:hypothetical protein